MMTETYEEYMAEMQKASADCWKCFTVSRKDRKNSSAVLASVCLKYKNRNSQAYEYVRRYTFVLSDMILIDDSYIKKIMEASREIWSMFKTKIKDIYDESLSEWIKRDGYWERLINDFIRISDKYWDSSIISYVRGYICVCLDEIDRIFRRKNEIRESQI